MKMSITRKLILAALLLMFLSGVDAGQEVKKYSKDGLTFNYSPEWELTDQGGPDMQQISLSNKETDSRILLIVARKKAASKESMADLKKQVVDPWVTSLVGMYTQVGISVERSEVNAEIAGEQAEGVRLKFTFAGQPAEATAYWLLIDKRLVLIYFIRPVAMTEKTSVGWDAVRKTLAVVDEKK